MSIPAIVLSLVIASLYAGLFHVAFARRASDLGYYWPAAILGFLLGTTLGIFVPRSPIVIGEVHLFEGTVLGVAALLLARWLRSKRKPPS